MLGVNVSALSPHLPKETTEERRKLFKAFIKPIQCIAASIISTETFREAVLDCFQIEVVTFLC